MKKWDQYSEELNKSEFSDYRLDEYRDCMKLNDNKFDNKLYSTHSDNIRDEYRNKKFNRFKSMGRLRRYNTYEFINDGNGLSTVTYNHDASGRKFKDIIKKTRSQDMMKNHVKYGLPLPITKNCKLVGIVRGRRRNSRAKPRSYEKDVILENFIDKVDVGYDDDEFDYLKPYSGDWMHSSQNLIDMATPKETNFTRYQIFEGYMSRRNIDLKLPYIGDYNSKFVLNQDINPKAYPGFSTSKKIAKFRRNTSGYTKEYAYKYVERVMKNERQILDTSLIVVGGREKRVNYKTEEKGKKVKTRVTCMHEDVPTLITGSVVNAITNCLPEIEDNFCQLAKVYGQGNMQKFVDCMSPKQWKELVCDLDYSGHDNNTSEEQVVAAFALFRLCFKESKEIDRLFYYIMSSMIHKRIVLPETNMVYHFNKGISTGHGMVALCTTFCAYGTLATAINLVTKRLRKHLRYRYLHSTYIENAGDDVNIKLNVDINSEVYNTVLKRSGHKVDDMNNNGYHYSNNYHSRVTFLKKKFIEYSWNYPELFTNLLHPTMKEKSFGDRYRNLKVLLYQSPCDNKFNNMLICLIICYILSGKGFNNLDMYAAQLDGRTLNIIALMDKCVEIGWTNVHFIDELKKLDYGSFLMYYNGEMGHDKYGEINIYGQGSVDLNSYIHNFLTSMKKDIKRKTNWFTTNIRYKMHRTKNTLTVYDFLKVYIKPKSNNISYDTLRIHYNMMELCVYNYNNLDDNTINMQHIHSNANHMHDVNIRNYNLYFMATYDLHVINSHYYFIY